MCCVIASMYRPLRLILLVGIGLGSASVRLAAENLTVCAESCDFATVQDAIDAAAPGDTVRVRVGTYRESLRIDKDLTIAGETSPETALATVIRGDGLATVVVVIAGATVAISGVTITGGRGSTGESANDGGGIYNAGILTLTEAIVDANEAVGEAAAAGAGAGIRNDGDLTMTRCVVSENRAAGGGGGIHNRGTLRLTGSTVCLNVASDGGGVLNEGRLTVTASTIADNEASGNGGGILTEGTCVLENSTVSGNDAGGHGGGISVESVAGADRSTRLVHSTVTANVAVTRQGSGVFNASATAVDLASSIVAINDPGRECTGAIRSLGHNIASDLSCDLDPRSEMPDQHATNPLLLELGHNGGPTLTHALRADSSAIDAADDASSCALATDQRGVPRSAGGRCDVGAYERPSCDPVVVTAEFVRGDTDDSMEIDLTDAIYLLEFLFLAGSPPGCEDAADADDDGRLLVSDAIFLLNWLFLRGAPLPAPASCGPDPIEDELGCVAASACDGPSPVFRDLWTSAVELRARPTAGIAWEQVLSAARDACPNEASVTNQDSDSNVQILAAAMAAARLADDDPRAAAVFRGKVIGAVRKLVDAGSPREAHGCPPGCGKAVNTTLAWGREVGAYVLAAELVGHRTPAFEDWLRNLAEVDVACDGRTMLEAFRKRPNNWGVMNFGSLVAIYAYLGDRGRLEQIRDYFVLGLTGGVPDCASTAGEEPCYNWGGTRDPEDKDMSWHCNPSSPHLIAPPCLVALGDGAEIDLDGLIPDDQRRSCSFCPRDSDDGICSVVSEAERCVEPGPDAHITDWMNGAVMGARILDRIGMGIWQSGDAALKRMIIAHLVTHCQVTCDDSGFQCESLYNCKDWVIPILDQAYDLAAELTPAPPTDCDCPLVLEGRGTGASKNAGFGAYIVR